MIRDEIRTFITYSLVAILVVTFAALLVAILTHFLDPDYHCDDIDTIFGFLVISFGGIIFFYNIRD